ncbi:YhdH/YhfP family quinone oxidoreductase [Pseudobacteriovorax antillogorgiicola]|uniref:NADPH2:quinone reductase n=1 Tax=Pseudobacteriovorax antillogorgiicola TaxID=1513793 RepID=A0A1Y6BYE1_9BACT|nr:YhdH/YhfP family quinone oxidoreductase [Pseudobacteriovorax antillogorgiicola]TCS50320.1 NADPH2:quinone reductase [Pseudobacteriovorax antillogorgiicola]SMF34179.1 NADPH2:quinone reductase [Pseudobacteriovorax antillogorgiicola]
MATFKALRVYRDGESVKNRIEFMELDDLDEGEVVIRSAYSSVNYKDALGATGAGRILKRFPMVAGIDVSGTVVSSKSDRFQEGQKVLVTGCGLGENHDGGYSEMVRVPAPWVVPIPDGLTPREAMILGTAGFTAGLCVHRLEQNGLKPDKGPVVVTGASGGVGSLAVSMLVTRGYEVIAVSGKKEQHDRLKELGAEQVLTVEELELGKNPLETARFGGAIDNVGGAVLEGLIRHTNLWGSIASVGLAMDFKFSNTVMPFILRGVSLLGISSTNCPYDLRCEVWKSLSGDLKPKALESFVAKETNLEGLNKVFNDMLERKTVSRTLVKLS